MKHLACIGRLAGGGWSYFASIVAPAPKPYVHPARITYYRTPDIPPIAA